MEANQSNKGKEPIRSSHPISAADEFGFEYDVFLSFEAGNCDLFASSLLGQLKDAGLRVFERPRIRFDFVEAFPKCKLCIPIFDERYVSSTICLDQVAKIWDRMRTRGLLVLPIFYMIDKSDVQNQTDLLDKPQVIDEWKEALREIGSLDGFTVNTFESISELPKSIVAQVMRLLKKYEVPVVVGMGQHVLEVMELLQTSSSKAQIIGICGIPGIGKTILAKALYSRLLPQFENCCCFISSIRERSGKQGLRSLEIKFIEDLLYQRKQNASLLVLEHEFYGSFDNNVEFIKDRFQYERVLIVLDDVECLDHIRALGVDLQCFGHGSIVILTTRKPELLVEANVPHRYFVEELDELHALKLFYSHAFEKDLPEGEYSHLADEIALSCRGIPLVIESVGSYLSNYRNKQKERWEEVLQQLRNSQYKLLQELLTLSHGYLSKGRWRFYHDKDCFPMGSRNDIAHYDVVLSFDARDRVKNLVESLHKRMERFGVGIFSLNGDYMQLNDTGKILIPVVSKSYASNSSCLEMLAHMVECRRSTTTNHILPIFCAIEPSDVRLQAPLYESSLCEDDKVRNRWKEALIEVANISGWSLPNTFTTEEFHVLVGSVCQMASDKLKLNQVMKNCVVGIDAHVESIWNLLNPEVNDVRSIAIRGEDGTGKTTLAKTLYHQLSSSFEGCSFLTEIDERTQHPDGIKYLQAKLISDLLNKECEVFASVSEGINLIKERFQHMKVLIVLDDVSGSSHVVDLVGQLSWFRAGSRIIITAGVTTEIPLPHSNYMIMNEHYWRRNFDTSCALLSMHTFRKGDPLPNFKSLSERIANLLLRSCHPWLALEIVGPLLYGKDIEEWQTMLRKFGNIDLKKILRMSYGRLNEMQKQIFLDFSCFPIGMDRQIVSYLWYDSLHSPGFTDNDLEALILFSLVKVDANNEIWMHRLVRDFGRQIVEERSQVKRRGETKRIKLEDPAPPGFKTTANIKFFKLDHTNVVGNRNSVLMTQRGIIWEWRPLDLLATLQLECLKVLDMSWSKVTENWEGWHQIKVPLLRVLNLTGCSDLMLTPAFSFCPDLEVLILEHCSRLVNIDPSIGQLQHLTTLNLGYCLELCMLPKEVGYLTALKELCLDGSSVREIPVSIGFLKNLHVLTAIDCLSLRHLPSSTCDLWFVTVIKLDRANIIELPYLIGKMKLQHLSLRGCRGIKRLASLVGEVESSLVELDVSKTSISELPESIIKLKALRVLKMDFCFIIEFPHHFGQLKKLEEIHAAWCRRLENLPDDIGELECLRILKVGHTLISTLPQSIKMLPCLESLDCTSCSKLQNLPELPSSLSYLHVESKELRELPDFAKLRRLKVFTLVNGDFPDVSMAVTAGKDDPFHWLNMSSFLRTLELCLSNIKTLPHIPYFLRKLSLRCVSLEYIPSLPARLVSLSIQDCTLLKKMPCVKYAEALEEMEILRCPEIKIIEDLEKLNALKVLTLSSCGIVSLDGLDKLTFLTRLTLSDCPELKQIEGFAKLKAVEVLSISSCGIESLTGLDKMASLKKLTLLDCGSLSEIPDLSTLKGADVFITENSY